MDLQRKIKMRASSPLSISLEFSLLPHLCSDHTYLHRLHEIDQGRAGLCGSIKIRARPPLSVNNNNSVHYRTPAWSVHRRTTKISKCCQGHHSLSLKLLPRMFRVQILGSVSWTKDGPPLEYQNEIKITNLSVYL